jgi:hypothetical protein
MLTFDGAGYLEVVFKPYSKYCYRRKEYIGDTSGAHTETEVDYLVDKHDNLLLDSEDFYLIEDERSTTIEKGTVIISNPSRKVYRPIIELTNNGDTSTVNKIGDFEITGLENGEKVIIDNQTMTVINENGENRFRYCNRKWVKLSPKTTVTLNVSGNCVVRVICEFPIIR